MSFTWGAIVIIALGIVALVGLIAGLTVLFRDEYRNHVDPE